MKYMLLIYLKVRMDSTVIETDIHYPTNNALMWDCIRTSTRLLPQLMDESVAELVHDYTRQAKPYYFRINVTNDKSDRRDLFAGSVSGVGSLSSADAARSRVAVPSR